jgi:effector-binding domain-containing protein
MFKIGDFSKLSRVSIKALHLYDRMGLLKPIQVDQFTSYRYYCASQLPRLNRILAFKDLGFSLEQILQFLDEELSPAEIRGMLRLKQAELEHYIETEQARLARVETRLHQIEREGNMSNYDVVIKKVEPFKVVSIREKLPSYSTIGRLFNELFEYLQQNGIKPGSYCAAIWHDPEYKESDVDGEAVISLIEKLEPTTVAAMREKPAVKQLLDEFTAVYSQPKERENDIDGEAIVSVDSPCWENERIRVYELPGEETMACTIHQGSYRTIDRAYNALLDWIQTNPYKIVGTYREFYIQGGDEQDNESYITEIQFPVSKVATS